jgi:alkanesulfonate monooxygenase SsuD/methylene tetrahydromethanopterin reductase-like flavin-dependent oxidoreductase (luciferase family)
MVPALVGNTSWTSSIDIRRRPARVPTRYISGRTAYDYRHHAEVGSDNAQFVTDDVVDRFAVVGDVQAHIAKLRALAEAGVDQFNVYLMNGDEEAQLEAYGKDIVPALRDVVATR